MIGNERDSTSRKAPELALIASTLQERKWVKPLITSIINRGDHRKGKSPKPSGKTYKAMIFYKEQILL